MVEILLAKASDHWEEVFGKADCCCSVVKSVREAMDDRHFAERGVFDADLRNERDDIIRALPTPIAPAFRTTRNDPRAPGLGAHNDMLADDVQHKDVGESQ